MVVAGPRTALAALAPAEIGGWRSLFDSSDVDATRTHMAGLFCQHFLDHRAIEAAPRFRLRHAPFGRVDFNHLTYDLYGGEAHVRVPALCGFYVLEFNLSGYAEIRTRAGQIGFAAGQMCVLNADMPHDKRWRTDGRQLLLRLESAGLRRALARLIDAEPRERIEFDPRPVAPDGPAGSLWRMVDLMCRELDAASNGLLARRAALSAEALLLDLVLETMPNNYSERIISALQSPRPGFMRRALAFVQDRLLDDISVEDIAGAAGVSVRALYDGFARHCGAPPMAYLRALRLDRAREALIGRAAAGGRVTDIALEHGFTHLGKFARAYARRFGERPSETIARSR